jgi:hypothetical protein
MVTCLTFGVAPWKFYRLVTAVQASSALQAVEEVQMDTNASGMIEQPPGVDPAVSQSAAAYSGYSGYMQQPQAQQSCFNFSVQWSNLTFCYDFRSRGSWYAIRRSYTANAACLYLF